MTATASSEPASQVLIRLPVEGIGGQRTSDAIARLIRLAIINGELEPGAHLREQTLAGQLGVSRTPIREALIVLSREGLIDLKPNRGGTVRRFSAQDLDGIYSLRAVLEAHAARTAAEHITVEQVLMLTRSCDRLAALQENADPGSQLDEDYAFHSMIGEAAENRFLNEMVQNVLAFTVTYRSQFAYDDLEMRSAVDQHRAVVVALAAGDGQRAAEALEAHVQWSRQVAIRHFH